MDNYSYNQPNGQTAGIIAIVLGIISILTAFIPCLGVFAIIPAVITLIFSTISIVRASNTSSPRGLSIAGFALAAAALLIATLWAASLRNTVIFNDSPTRFGRLFDQIDEALKEIDEIDGIDEIELIGDDDFYLQSDSLSFKLRSSDSTVTIRARRVENKLRQLEADSIVSITLIGDDNP